MARKGRRLGRREQRTEDARTRAAAQRANSPLRSAARANPNNKFAVRRALDAASKNPALNIYTKPSKSTRATDLPAEEVNQTQPFERKNNVIDIKSRSRGRVNRSNAESKNPVTCKTKPRNNATKGGNSRPFIPWCKK